MCSDLNLLPISEMGSYAFPGNGYFKLGRVRPTQSIMYVPLQVNRFWESVLLMVQYKDLKSCSRRFYSPESDPPHKIMLYWFYYSI